MSKVFAPPDLPPLSPWRRFVEWNKMLWADHSFFRFVFNTRSQIAPGVYRSSHPMPYQLRSAQRAGVRTVLNLRGPEQHVGSNQIEWDACRRLGLKLVHFPIGSRDAPSREQVLTLIELLGTLPRGLLIHCKSGADRAGLASTIYMLVYAGQPLDQALKQLSFWRHGHVHQAKTGILDHFFEHYRLYCAQQPIGFEDWIRTVYDRKAVIESFHSSWWANKLVDAVLHRE